jgi:hypothetical protein
MAFDDEFVDVGGVERMTRSRRSSGATSTGRRALDDAVRRGWMISNSARVAHAPKRRPLASNTSKVGLAVSCMSS